MHAEAMMTMKIDDSAPRPPAIVTVSNGKVRNAIACSWNMPVSFDPLLIGASIDYSTASFPLLEEVKAWGVSYLPWDLAWVAATVGSCSMKDVPDKFDTFGIKVKEDEEFGVPVIEGANTYVCSRFGAVYIGDHAMFVGKVRKTCMEAPHGDPCTLYLGHDAYSKALTTSVLARDLLTLAPGNGLKLIEGESLVCTDEKR